MKHICKIIDFWDNEESCLEYTTSDKDLDWAVHLSIPGIEEFLLKYCRDNMVGKLIPTTGQPAYFTPAFRIGGAILSMQLNYPLWSQRTDLGITLTSPMTSDEFDSLSGSWFDFKLYFVREMECVEIGAATQMKLHDIARLLYDYFVEPEWEYQP